MPLEIHYRPIVLPAAARGPERAPAPVPLAEPLAGPVRVETVRPAPAKIGAKTGAKAAARRGFGWRDLVRRLGNMRGQRLWGIVALGVMGLALGAVGWGDPGGIDPAQARPRVAGLQPFEQAGDSFPGSAFYYVAPEDNGLLAPAAAQQAWNSLEGNALEDGTVHRDDAIAGPAGPAARPLSAAGSWIDRTRALTCLTAAIYYEAATEPDGGQRAVAQVVLNRVAHPAFPKTVCGVVYQGSERPSCQFSFACDGSMARRPMAAFWERARRVASDALAGNVYAPVGLATHYHTSAIHPYWADSLTFLGTIGAHRFYRWSGAAGRPAAFTTVYAGGEPLAAPHPRTWVPAQSDIADPLALEKAYENGRLEALRRMEAAGLAGGQAGGAVNASFGQIPLAHGVNPAPAAADTGTRGTALTGAGAAARSKSQASGSAYENAGKWIAQPTS